MSRGKKPHKVLIFPMMNVFGASLEMSNIFQKILIVFSGTVSIDWVCLFSNLIRGTSVVMDHFAGQDYALQSQLKSQVTPTYMLIAKELKAPQMWSSG